MPKLYIKEYQRTLEGVNILIACRKEVLREHIDSIVRDIKFLARQGIYTTLVHNLPNRLSNHKLFKLFETKLPGTNIYRCPLESGDDFYEYALNIKEKFGKLIFIERKYLSDENGCKINTLTTRKALRMIREKQIFAYGDLITNINFKGIIEKICQKIEQSEINRIHIVPAGKYSLKHELFSLEGTGTLIANDFSETMESVASAEQVRIVSDILQPYIKRGLIKPRDRNYVEKNRKKFYIAKIDDIVVGCLEKIDLDRTTIELGALAVATRFRNQQIGIFLIQSFVALARKQGCQRIISLTRNPKLQKIYQSFGFKRKIPQDLEKRKKRSPEVPMYVYYL
jgi:N-acetylglutamate synthase-like GNAT family acetyltransferase